MRILVVEDDLINQMFLEKVLSRHGDLTLTRSGSAGLAAFFQAHRTGAPFDLICLDIMLPELDGHSVLQKVRAFEAENKVPAAKVVVMTALDDSNNVLCAFRTGCEAYLVKPIDAQNLLYEMQKLGLIMGRLCVSSTLQ